jgi:poly-beta-1,6-N-acetyl-D-glucosamine synthase
MTREMPTAAESPARIRCSIGVIAEDDGVDLEALLAALQNQHVHQADIVEILVVSGSDRIEICSTVQEFAAREPRIRFIQQDLPGRVGAVNAFLAACTTDICVLESVHTLPHESAVENLVRMFSEPELGMVGAQKVMVDTPDYVAGLLSYLRLRMEHLLCLEIPRLREMVAFRKVFDAVPPDVALDEAFVEALMVQRGLRIQYAPDAIVYSTGPTTVRAFVQERRRNHTGYLHLKRKYGYVASSIQNKPVFKVAIKQIWGAIQFLWVMALLAGLEIWSRILGWYDFAIARERHVVWDMAWSQKQDVQEARRSQEQ